MNDSEQLDIERKNFFDSLSGSENFDGYTDEQKTSLLHLLDDIHFPHGEKLIVLDCGCGTGRTTGLLAERIGVGSVITGVDYSPSMIERASSLRKSTENVSVEFIVADCHSLPFENGTFDWVLIIETLPHFRNIEEALTEIRRVMKEGAYIGILHRKPSDEINKFHASQDGPVKHDLLPPVIEILAIFRKVDLWVNVFIDDSDGFRILARK